MHLVFQELPKSEFKNSNFDFHLSHRGEQFSITPVFELTNLKKQKNKKVYHNIPQSQYHHNGGK